MPSNFSHDLHESGVAFNGYRELAQPIQHAHSASRWPLLALTDQVLVAQRWKRNAMNRQVAPSNVTSLPSRPTAAEAPQDWFGATPQAAQNAPVRAGSR